MARLSHAEAAFYRYALAPPAEDPEDLLSAATDCLAAAALAAGTVSKLFEEAQNLWASFGEQSAAQQEHAHAHAEAWGTLSTGLSKLVEGLIG
jgi:hypothetical protein